MSEQSWIHTIAGISAQFHAEDMGYTLVVDYTTILGQLPGVDTWVVQVDGHETDRGEYWWDTTKFLVVSGPPTQPSVNDATNEQVRRVL